MAIFHWHLQTISRAAGRSAVAAAAYRAGERLADEHTGLVHDFRRRHGVARTEIVLPAGADPALVVRARLWNQAEAWERRRDAVVAREVIVALPHELSQDAQVALLRGHAEHIAASLGVAVDVALHLPGERSQRRALAAAGLPGGDSRNTHGHLLWTARRVAGPGIGQKTRELDDRKTGSAIIEALRADWEARVNVALKDAALEVRVDRRSHVARGNVAVPAPKLGAAATGMEGKGIATERGCSWRVARDDNAAIAEVDRVIAALEEERTKAVDACSREEMRCCEEVPALLVRRHALEREIRQVAAPLNYEAALDCVSGGEHRRLRSALVHAREHERRAHGHAAGLRWWQLVPRWRARQQEMRWGARRLSLERALAEAAEVWGEQARQMVADDEARHGDEQAQQEELRRALQATARSVEAALRRWQFRTAVMPEAAAALGDQFIQQNSRFIGRRTREIAQPEKQ